MVAALALRDDTVLLTQRRADQPHPLFWELPGGKVEAGEAPEQALRRELREEIAVDLQDLTIYDVVFHRYPEYDVLLLVYRCRVVGEPRTLEVNAARWVTLSNLSGINMLPADRALFERLAREGLPNLQPV